MQGGRVLELCVRSCVRRLRCWWNSPRAEGQCVPVRPSAARGRARCRCHAKGRLRSALRVQQTQQWRVAGARRVCASSNAGVRCGQEVGLGPGAISGARCSMATTWRVCACGHRCAVTSCGRVWSFVSGSCAVAHRTRSPRCRRTATWCTRSRSSAACSRRRASTCSGSSLDGSPCFCLVRARACSPCHRPRPPYLPHTLSQCDSATHQSLAASVRASARGRLLTAARARMQGRKTTFRRSCPLSSALPTRRSACCPFAGHTGTACAWAPTVLTHLCHAVQPHHRRRAVR